MKKILSWILVLLIVSSCVTSVMAVELSESNQEPSSDLGQLIGEKSYIDENTGSKVTDRVYFIPDKSSSTIRSVSGNGWYTNEKVHVWSGESAYYYVQAYYSWNNGSISVSNPTSWNKSHPSNIEIVEDYIYYGVDWHWFHDCGFAVRHLQFRNIIGNYTEFNVTMRVNSTNGSACW